MREGWRRTREIPQETENWRRRQGWSGRLLQSREAGLLLSFLFYRLEKKVERVCRLRGEASRKNLRVTEFMKWKQGYQHL